MLRIGLISDTHGLLRPEALAFLRGSDHIVHAGNIGNQDILQKLSAIAPVTAVRGNNDKDEWARTIPETQLVKFGKTFVYVLHDLAELDIEPKAAGVDIVVSGHSHRPIVEKRDGVLFVNPGSAGPRRFKLPIAVGELVIANESIAPRIVELGN
ncbi:MAG: metallophosphoesterase family protein [Rudaea sp.]|nr:metallophosphoesterase family protein [Rudaea sp.]